jgi:hypothetical protein
MPKTSAGMDLESFRTNLVVIVVFTVGLYKYVAVPRVGLQLCERV